MIRVGILGCANVARRSLAPAFASSGNFRIVAIGSRSREKAEDFAAEYFARPCTYDALIDAHDIDLLYCPLPTGMHHEWVARALESGKHVLCEKSLACNYDDVKDLVGMARKKNLFLMESFQFRFHPQNIRVKELLQNGAIGAIRSVDVKFGFPPFADGRSNIRYSKSLGGGALLDAGAYAVKGSTFLLGDNLNVKAASTCSHEECDVDLDGRLWMERHDGVVSTAAYGFHNYYQCGYEIWGERGIIRATRAFTAKKDYEAEVFCESASGLKVEKFKADHFSRMLDYVLLCLKGEWYEDEYRECLNQARLIDQARRILEF